MFPAIFGGTTTQNQTSQIQWDPALLQKTLSALGLLQGQVGNAAGAARSAANQMTTNFGTAPALQTNFQQYAGGLAQPTQLGGPLDSRSEQMLGNMRGERTAQAAAQAGQLSRTLAPGVANALNAQGRNMQALAGNTDRLQLSQLQDQRLGTQAQVDAQRAQILTALGQAGNQAQLQGLESRLALGAAGNNALSQWAQMNAVPASLYQGLIASLGQVGQGTGKQVTTGSQRTPGLFG